MNNPESMKENCTDSFNAPNHTSFESESSMEHNPEPWTTICTDCIYKKGGACAVLDEDARLDAQARGKCSRYRPMKKG